MIETNNLGASRPGAATRALCVLLLLLLPMLAGVQIAAAASPTGAQTAQTQAGDAADQSSGDPGANKPAPKPAADKSARQAGASSGPSDQRPSLTRRLAQTTAGWATTVGAAATDLWQTVTASGPGAQSGPSFSWPVLVAAAYKLGLVIVAAFVVLLVLRQLIRRLLSASNRVAANTESSRATAAFLRRAGAMGLALAADVIGVLLAAAAASAVAAYVVDAGTVAATRASLFVNAFVLVELIKVAIRTVFSANYSALRPVPVGSSLAAWWGIRLRWLVGGILYSTLVAVPILENQISARMGALLYFVTMLVALIAAIRALVGHRHVLSGRLTAKAEAATSPVFAFLFRLAARLWLVLACIYLIALLVLSQLHSSAALVFFAWATLQTVIAAAIAWLACWLISAAKRAPSRLSPSIKQKIPQLEGQLNRYAPILSVAAKVLVLFLLAGAVVNIWHLVDFAGWIQSPAGAGTVGAAVRVLLVLLVAAAIWIVASSIIEFKLSPNTGSGAPSARQQTLMALFRNALAIVIATLTFMIALSQIGVNIGPLIASAGILGLAIGFGAQNLVADVIAGVFIQLENSMNTGDVVTAAGVTGTVERLTIRSVAIRDLDGTFHVVPFSSASVVSNYMRDWAVYRGEYRIAYGEDIDTAIARLHDAFADLKNDPEAGPNVLEEMAVPGVCEIEDSAVRIRIMVTVVPGTQWGVGRVFNRLVKIHLDRAGIEIPFPHRTMYFGNNTQVKPRPVDRLSPPGMSPGDRGDMATPPSGDE